ARGLEVSAHTQECDTCRTLLRALERESRLLTRAMLEENEPLPSRLAQFQERARKSMQWIWGLVFGLAATGAYALYTGYVLPWEQQLEQAGFGGSNLLSLLIFQGAMWKGWQSMITLLEVLAGESEWKARSKASWLWRAGTSRYPVMFWATCFPRRERCGYRDTWTEIFEATRET